MTPGAPSRAPRRGARTSTGGSLTLGYPLADRLHGFLTYRLENVGITSGFSGFAGLGATVSQLPALDTANLLRGGWTSSIRGSVAYDTRDNRLFPKTGEYATAYAEYAGWLTGSENELVRCSRPGSDACTSGFDAIGSLRKSVGLGVRWLSPIGPLRFEWGPPARSQARRETGWTRVLDRRLVLNSLSVRLS